MQPKHRFEKVNATRQKQALSIPVDQDRVSGICKTPQSGVIPPHRRTHSYPLKMNVDNRGSFTEFIWTPERGQVSVNVSRPGIMMRTPVWRLRSVSDMPARMRYISFLFRAEVGSVGCQHQRLRGSF